MDRSSGSGVDSLALVLSGQGSEVSCVLNPPIYLNGAYEMCMLSLQTYNSIPNVTNKNNVFKYYSMVPEKPNAWVEMIIPEGTYDIHDLEKYIHGKLQEEENDKNFFVLSANSNTMKVSMKASVDVDFTVENSIGSLFGFHKKIIGGHISVSSDEIVDINKISAIDIMCNVVDGSYINGELAHVLYHFYPNVPPGFKIIEVPEEKIYMPVNTSVLSNINIRAVDQNGQLINLRGEELTLYLRLRGRH